MGTRSLAWSAMYFKSATRSAQTGQSRRCCSCSALPPVSMIYGNTRWNSAHVISSLSQSNLPFRSCHSSCNSPFCPALPSGCLLSMPDCLFCSADLEEVAQFHARFVHLRFAVPDGAAHHFCDLIMLVAFDIVQHEDDAVPGRQTFNRPFQVHAVDRAREDVVARPDVLLWAVFLLWLERFVERNFRQPFFP